MKKQTGTIKRRIIAIALSVITLSSFATMSLTTASAATSSQTISAVVNKNTVNLLKGSTATEKQAIKDIKEIKKFVDDYKAESEKTSKKEKLQKRNDRIEKYVTSGVEAVNNIAKGEYVSAVKNVVGLFPYGGIISGVIDLFTTLFTPAPEEPDLVPEVSLKEIEEQLGTIKTSIDSLKEAIKQNENNEFYKCLNQIVLVYKDKGSVIMSYIKNKAKLLDANKNLEAAIQEKDAKKIEESKKAVEKAKNALSKSQKLIDNFFGDDNLNDLYRLRDSLKQCTQYMNGTNFSIKADKAEGNPFLINFKAKVEGAKTGTSIDSIIEQCIKDNEAIWNYYELGITMYSALAPSYIKYLNDRKQSDKADANNQEYVSFMTGIYPSGGTDTLDNKINAIDVHDYYMTTILPKMLESSGMYKFKDNTVGEKVAEVSCNGETEIFKSFDEAWAYATKYTNTKITLCKDVEIEGDFKTSSAHKNNIELDFQGHILTLAGFQYYDFFTITNNDSLKIYSSNGTGSIVRTKDHSGNSCINNENGTLKIENCIIENSGGSFIINTKGNAEIINCTFKNNTSYSGGAIYSKADIKINNCIFENNKSHFNGGAIAIYDGSSYINNCTFNNNIAERENGGAIYYANGLSAPKISNSTFTNNYSHDDGGAIYVSAHTDIDIGNTVFRYNESRNIGGAIYLGQLRSTNHYFRNVTIEYNKCGKEGGGVFADACGCNTADIKLFGWNKIRYNTNAYGSASNAKMIKSTCRTVFKIMDDFDTYNSDIRGTTNSDGSCMVFLNTSSDYVYYHSYGMQSGAFKADNGKLEQSGSGVYWYK